MIEHVVPYECYIDKKELLSCVVKKVQKVESVISRLKNSLSLTLQTNGDGIPGYYYFLSYYSQENYSY